MSVHYVHVHTVCTCTCTYMCVHVHVHTCVYVYVWFLTPEKWFRPDAFLRHLEAHTLYLFNKGVSSFIILLQSMTNWAQIFTDLIYLYEYFGNNTKWEYWWHLLVYVSMCLFENKTLSTAFRPCVSGFLHKNKTPNHSWLHGWYLAFGEKKVHK